jgi:tRNA(fMet)-specific endonuclease VapC
LPFDDADAIAAAAIRADLHQRGQPIGAYDIQIAGCGIARGLVVVTSNEADFRRVSGLRVENWRHG